MSRRFSKPCLLALALALAGCQSPKATPATTVESIAYVDSASPPRIVLVETTKANRGGKSLNSFDRLDVRDVGSGEQVGVYVFGRGEIRNQSCYPGEQGRVWCYTITNPTIETWDITTLERSEDLDALAARFPAMRDVVLNQSPAAVPGTGEIEIKTGQGDRWIVGPDPIQDDGSEEYQARLRGVFADEPKHQFSLSRDAQKIELWRDRKMVVSELSPSLESASLLVDQATNETICWESERLLVAAHTNGPAGVELVGLGYDGTKKWEAEVGGARLIHTARLPDAVVVVTGDNDKALLTAVGVADGEVRWSREL